MTEQEAKTKWCPFARTVWNDGSTETASWNRWVGDKPDEQQEKPVSKCIGSSCMAWRFDYSESVNDGVVRLGKPPGELNPPFSNCPDGYAVTSHGSDGMFSAVKNERTIEHFFCGLAGKP